MAVSREQRKDAYLAKAEGELASLRARGVVSSGMAMAPVVLLKGEPSPEELGEAGLLSGADGDALRAALVRLGYAPEEWAGLSAVACDGQPLDAALLREAIMCLDPVTLVVLDGVAADQVRLAFANELAAIPAFDQAMLADGTVANVLGMRVLALGGFERALGDAHEKQVMWARLKQIPPLGEPY